MPIDGKYLVDLKGKTFCLWAGLLDAATKAGLRRIEVNLIQFPAADNGHLAISQATATFEDGRIFTELGDAGPANCSAMIAAHAVRMSACVPLTAEILTQEGFKPYQALAVGVPVLAYNCAADRCEWTPLRAIALYPEPEPTVRLSSRSCSFVCTPHHSWAVRNNSGTARLKPAFRFGPGDRIVQAAPGPSGDSELTVREAAILGWLATDGNTRESMVTGRWGTFGPYLRATIYQSKERYLPVIRDLLGADASELIDAPKQRDFGFMGGKISDCRQSHRWQLKAQFLRQIYRRAEIGSLSELPRLVLRLSQAARGAMLEAMLQAEGHQNGPNRWDFYQRKDWVMESFVLLATLEGRALGASAAKGVRWDCRTLRSNRHLTCRYLQREQAPDQPVWCPTTDFGTWVMRHEGMVTITGNTRAKGRALRDALNIGEAMFEELGPDGDSQNGHQVAPPKQAQRARHDPAHHAEQKAAEEPAAAMCEQCGEAVPAPVATAARKLWGVVLCVVHGKERRELEKQAPAQAQGA